MVRRCMPTPPCWPAGPALSSEVELRVRSESIIATPEAGGGDLRPVRGTRPGAPCEAVDPDLPRGQVQEPRILPHRIERRIDPEPARRQVIRNLEQWLELIERLLRLPHEQVDPDQLQLNVRAAEAVLRERIQLHTPEAVADGLVLPAEIGEH